MDNYLNFSLNKDDINKQRIPKIDELIHVKDNVYYLNGEFYTLTRFGIRKPKVYDYKKYKMFSYRYNGISKLYNVTTHPVTTK